MIVRWVSLFKKGYCAHLEVLLGLRMHALRLHGPGTV